MIKTICVLYTSYHSFEWDLVAENINIKNCLVINFSKRALKNNLASGERIEKLNTHKLIFFLKCLLIATKAKFNYYNLIIPHPDNIFGNTLFFGKKVKNITILEDGILNYYNYEKTGLIEKAVRRRRLVSYFTPFRYKLYDGHHSGIESYHERQFDGIFSDPENIVKRECFKQIKKLTFPRKRNKKTNTELVVIFLDQPIEAIVSPIVATELRKMSIDFINKNFKSVFYKPHPEYIQTGEKFANQIDLNDVGILPFEEFLLHTNPDVVVSFCSTALINAAKMSLGIRCISLGMDQILPFSPGFIQIKDLFILYEIEII